MNKFCVFCGNKPENKNKEHIIPQWLISLTGDSNRKASFGPIFDLNTLSLKDKEFAFDEFKFPACRACNQKFSDFENQARDVVMRLLDEKPLSDLDFMILLDWLDKIRIGLWLAFNYLQKNIYGIEPGFFIENRISHSDRAVCIYKSDLKESRLNFYGVSFPVFQHRPICFTLRINQFFLFNMGTDHLISERIGIPYVSDSTFTEEKEILVVVNDGKERISTPLIKKALNRQCSQIYQPIFSLKNTNPEVASMYDTEYVKSIAFNYEQGLGKVFFAQDNKIAEYPSLASKNWIPKKVWHDETLLETVYKQTLEFQLYFLNNGPRLGNISEQKKRSIKSQYDLARKVNRLFLGLR